MTSFPYNFVKLLVCIKSNNCFITLDTGRIVWNDPNNSVELFSPSLKQCEDVINRLKEEEQSANKWNIHLYQSSSESAEIIVKNLNLVRGFVIYLTTLESSCVSVLSDELTTNETLKVLHFYYSPLTGGVKKINDALYINKSLEVFWFNGVPMTEEDVTQLSDMLSVNTTLQSFRMIACDITDNYVKIIYDGLAKNHTLTYLNLSHNHEITTDSTSIIAELIKTTTSLAELYFDDTSLKDDDIKILCETLTVNDTIQTLGLSKALEESCKTFDCYQSIRNRIRFFDTCTR